MLDTLVTALAPYIMQTLAITVTGLVGWIAVEVKKRFGIEIEAKHREALHSALMTGARLALSRRGVDASTEVLTLVAVEYARSAVPDAISKLGVSPMLLAELAEAKLDRPVILHGNTSLAK